MKYFFIRLAMAITPLGVIASPHICSDRIKIDQFGYRPADQKIAVISSPQKGFNAVLPDNFEPGATYELREWFSDKIVFTGNTTIWNNGAIHDQSGDKVWWFDFSSYAKTGSYYLHDTKHGINSYRFEIGDDVYDIALVMATRMFLYQRCNFKKTAKYCGEGWTDEPAFMGKNQDKYCLSATNPIPSTMKDVSGGWFDAGDFNKYTAFAFWPLQDLLLSYEENKKIWRDDYNIPESGNGIPDILDEVKYELDWLLKMQLPDGNLLSKVAVSAYKASSPPSTDTATRRYGKPSTNATLTGAMAFALASKQFAQFASTKSYAATLKVAAIKAWKAAMADSANRFKNEGFQSANPDRDNAYGGGFPKDYSQYNFLVAAVYLYALTRDVEYKNYVENNYVKAHMMSGEAFYIYENYVYQALTYYTTLQGITAKVKDSIIGNYIKYLKNEPNKLPAFIANKDAYRAYMEDRYYEWGSTWRHMMQANFFTDMYWYGLDNDKEKAKQYQHAAAGYLHHMHGVNPLALVYVSNMNKYGAEKSIKTFYHNWFTDGSYLWDEVGTSKYGPPPGYFGEGPNPNYTVNMWPKGELPQKAYKEWNTAWNGSMNEAAYEVTEVAIYYQAAYIRVLSKFASGKKGFPGFK
jgi:endoglucanase